MEAFSGNDRGPAWRRSSLAAAVLLLAASWAAAPAAAEGLPADEDPPQTGFGPLHDPLAPLPDREAGAAVPGLLEVSRTHEDPDEGDSAYARDRVAVRVLPAPATLVVTYRNASYDGTYFRTQATAVDVRACVPGECLEATAGYVDGRDPGSVCDTSYSTLGAEAEGEDVAYREDRTDCASGDDRNEFRCRHVEGDAADAHLIVDRCSHDQVDEGNRTRNENGYRVTFHTSGAVVTLRQTNNLVQAETRTEVEVRTPLVDGEAYVALPPEPPAGS